jgi:hypothetical protein
MYNSVFAQRLLYNHKIQSKTLLTYNNTKDYRRESVSSPAIDRLLALHSVFDNIEAGAQRH